MPLTHDLMPVPAELEFSAGRWALSSKLIIAISGQSDARLQTGIARALVHMEERTGITFTRDGNGEFPRSADKAQCAFVIECEAASAITPVLGEDESYTLRVTATQAQLHAPTTLGILRGLQTLAQLVQADNSGWFVPIVTVTDRPRFPWRGLMIDVSRHWQPLAVIKRNLDGMEFVKLNVLHLHLTDDQGFRIESKLFPELAAQGSDGNYFTQDEIRDIIGYAAARGIRVVPEFDIPGHATSWLVVHPEWASAPGPYAIERKWGVHNPVLDPTNPGVYAMLEKFLGEMAGLFPDAYLHIGGDENNGVQWNANPKIQQFIREHQLHDNAGLHAYFNTHLHAILARHGKKMIGWDEILSPDIPAGSVIHSWRGPDGIAAATRLGFSALLSNGYYIDLNRSTREHYLNDPIPVETKLTLEQQKLVLGGEATMWSEWVTPETIDSRIWPRTAAIAERLWSSQGIRDVTDMYRRLAIISLRLTEMGLRHESSVAPALQRLAGDDATPAELEALRTFADLIEPVKGYRRGEQQPDATQFTPLVGLADCARADSATAREFSGRVDVLVFGQNSQPVDISILTKQLALWRASATELSHGLALRSPLMREVGPLLQSLVSACNVGDEALQLIASGHAPVAEWQTDRLAILKQAESAHGAVELPIIAALQRLVKAAAAEGERTTLSPEAWRARLSQ